MSFPENVQFQSRIISPDKPEKLTPAQAGFTRPPMNVDSPITPDRFCCGNCPRYIPETKECYIVAIEDINTRDCCNHFLFKDHPLAESEREQPIYTADKPKAKIPITSGFASSKKSLGIVNGIRYATVVANSRNYY